MNGLFITFEGTEGSGKSTQISRLAERLKQDMYVQSARAGSLTVELRGEGALLGTRQSGLSDLRFTRLRADRDLLEQARGLARELAGEDGPWLDAAQALLVGADPASLA